MELLINDKKENKIFKRMQYKCATLIRINFVIFFGALGQRKSVVQNVLTKFD